MKSWPSEDSLVREDCLSGLHNLLMTNFQVFKLSVDQIIIINQSINNEKYKVTFH